MRVRVRCNKRHKPEDRMQPAPATCPTIVLERSAYVPTQQGLNLERWLHVRLVRTSPGLTLQQLLAFCCSVWV